MKNAALLKRHFFAPIFPTADTGNSMGGYAYFANECERSPVQARHAPQQAIDSF
jgi:hypothetical protein